MERATKSDRFVRVHAEVSIFTRSLELGTDIELGSGRDRPDSESLLRFLALTLRRQQPPRRQQLHSRTLVMTGVRHPRSRERGHRVE